MDKDRESKDLVVVGKSSRAQLTILNQFHIFSIIFVVLLNFGIATFLFGEGLIFLPSLLAVMSLIFLWFFAGSILQSLATLKLLSNFNNPNHLALELYLRKMTKILFALPVKKEPYLMFLYYYTSFTQQYQGKHKDAIEQIEKTNLEHMGKKGFRYPYLVTELSSLAISFSAVDRLDEALLKVEEAIAVCNEQPEGARHALIYPLTAKAAILIKQKKFDKAKQATKQSLKVINSIRKPPVWMLSISVEQYKLSNVCQLATIALSTDDLEKIELYFMQIDSIYSKSNDVVTPLHFNELAHLAKLLMEKDRQDLAKRILQMIYSKAAQTPLHPDIAQILDLYEEVLILEGRKDDIANMRAWLLPVNNQI